MHRTLQDIAADLPRPVAQPRSAARLQIYLTCKRAFDIAVVLTAALPAGLLVCFAAVAIRVTEGRPVLFIQDRVGRGGRTFRMLKLRTMTTGPGKVMHATLKNDARITPLGNFLRKTHLDELPQLWNILVGDMSLIGPRPEQPHLVDFYCMHIPQFAVRHAVRPGLTGLAQVSFGYAADLDETRRKFRYDYFYVQHMGLALDLAICVKTVQVYANPGFVR